MSKRRPISKRNGGTPSADICEELENRYPLALEHIAEYAIFMTKPDGLVCTWNSGVERVLGYAREEWVGKSVGIIFTAEDRSRGAPKKEMAQAAKRGKACADRWCVRRDGSQFWASGVNAAIKDDKGELLGFCTVLRDNSDRKDAERALQSARDDATKKVQERTAELTTALEQLRTDAAGKRQLEAVLAAAVDAERRRFGQELHDGICQELLGTALLAAAKAKDLAERDGSTAETLMSIGAKVRAAAQHVREMAWGLHPIALCDNGLAGALRGLADITSEVVQCTFRCRGKGTLDAPSELHVYRIVQEAVANAVKHAKPRRVEIDLTAKANRLTICVSDDGSGFQPDQSSGMGLRNMRSRAEAIGGQLAIESSTGAGTRVICTIG